MNNNTMPFNNTMSEDELKESLSQSVHDYHMIYEELYSVNEHRPSSEELKKEITDALIEKSYEMAYFAGELLEINESNSL